MILRSVGVLSVGKIQGCLGALFGLLAGAVFSLLALAGVAAGGGQPGPFEILFGVAAVVILPLFYGMMGFLGGIITALLYNVVAGIVGGIELELTPIHAAPYAEQ